MEALRIKANLTNTYNETNQAQQVLCYWPEASLSKWGRSSPPLFWLHHSDQRCSTPATGLRGRSSRYLTRHQPGKGRGSWTNGTQSQINGLLGKGPVHDITKISCGRSPNCNTNKETLTYRHMIWIGPLRLTAAEEKLKSSSCWQILPSEVQCPIYQTEFHTFVDKNFRLFIIFK